MRDARIRHRHAPETAAGRLALRALTAGPQETAADLLRRIAAQRPDATEVACLVDGAGRLVGVVRLGDALAAPPGTPLSAVRLPRAPVARTTDDQEHVASLAVHADVDAVPVVDAEGRLAGVVPAREIIAVLRREHVEDLHRMAGIRRERARPRGVPPSRHRGVRDRLPWLLVGLAGSVVATAVMSGFESTLRRTVAVAFFVPGIVYLADAIGTQTEAIMVRALSLGGVSLRARLPREVATGAAIGACFGALALPAVGLALGDVRLGAAVAVSLLVAGTVAAGIGMLLPWALARAGRDPALGSGPLATIVQDVLSLLVYFAACAALLGTAA